MTVKSGRKKQRQPKQRRPSSIVMWDDGKRTWKTESNGVKTDKRENVAMLIKEFVAMRDERNSLVAQLDEERKKFSEMVQLRIEATRLQYQLELVRLITEGKKEEAIASVLRSDVMLFGVEVRFADDKTLEKARQEWYDKGKQDAIAAIRGATQNDKH